MQVRSGSSSARPVGSSPPTRFIRTFTADRAWARRSRDRDRVRRSATERTQDGIRRVVEPLSDTLSQEPRDQIAVLLEKRVLPSITSIRVGIPKVLASVQVHRDPHVPAQQVHFERALALWPFSPRRRRRRQGLSSRTVNDGGLSTCGSLGAGDDEAKHAEASCRLGARSRCPGPATSCRPQARGRP